MSTLSNLQVGGGPVKISRLITARSAVAPAFGALNYEIVDLKRFGMKQDRVALGAQVIDGLRAGDQNWWGTNDRAVPRRWNCY